MLLKNIKQIIIAIAAVVLNILAGCTVNIALTPRDGFEKSQKWRLKVRINIFKITIK